MAYSTRADEVRRASRGSVLKAAHASELRFFEWSSPFTTLAQFGVTADLVVL
jgi:hypothetical protein